MSERPQEHDFVRASINQEQGGIPGIHLPEEVPLLGSGGQGWVFYAVETDTGTPRALKVHRAIEGLSAEDAERSAKAFENEGKWLQQFDHPNIIKVFRTGVHERAIRASGESSGLEHVKDYRFMLMEYAELGSVADRIDNNRKVRNIGMLPVEEAALCIVHATEGMRYAHGELGDLPKGAHGVTHGDLNKRNLVVAAADGRNRVVKVADFGIARRAHSGVETMTSTQFHAFSEAYASSNQIRTGNVFYADDIYSLGGVTAYELLSGALPFNPENKTLIGYLEAHETAEILPMERMNGDRIDRVVEALNEPVLNALSMYRQSGSSKPKYTTMGEYQADFNEALAKGIAEAAKERTIIIMPKKKDTLPLSAHELLEAELPPEAATADINVSRAETLVPPVPSSTDTEVVDEFPRDTNLLKNASGLRRWLLGAIGLGAAGAITGGAIWIKNIGESPEERAEREKLDKERAAIAGLAYKVVDLLAKQEKADSTVPAVIEQIIPYDPPGVAPRIEQIQASDNYYNASQLAAHLAYYNQPGAQKIMQTYLDQKKYGNAAVIAAQFASFARLSAGEGSKWRDEAERVRSVIATSTDSLEAGRSYYTKMITAALNPTDASAAQTLREFIDRDPTPGLEALSLAMAPHNPNAVADEIFRLIDRANALPANAEDGIKEWHYNAIEQMCQTLAPYAPDRVEEAISRIDNPRPNSDRAEFAVQRGVVELAAYRPDPAIRYVKNGSEDPSRWQSSHWALAVAVALGHTNPSLVTALRPRAISAPFIEWMDVSVDPLDPDLVDKAYAALANPNYLKNYGVELATALLKSRQPKR